MRYQVRGSGRCPTGKVRFRNETSATLALQLARSKRAFSPPTGKVEDHAYACPTCAGWHLTSRLQETA